MEASTIQTYGRSFLILTANIKYRLTSRVLGAITRIAVNLCFVATQQIPQLFQPFSLLYLSVLSCQDFNKKNGWEGFNLTALPSKPAYRLVVLAQTSRFTSVSDICPSKEAPHLPSPNQRDFSHHPITSSEPVMSLLYQLLYPCQLKTFYVYHSTNYQQI